MIHGTPTNGVSRGARTYARARLRHALTTPSRSQRDPAHGRMPARARKPHTGRGHQQDGKDTGSRTTGSQRDPETRNELERAQLAKVDSWFHPELILICFFFFFSTIFSTFTPSSLSGLRETPTQLRNPRRDTASEPETARRVQPPKETYPCTSSYSPIVREQGRPRHGPCAPFKLLAGRTGRRGWKLRPPWEICGVGRV